MSKRLSIPQVARRPRRPWRPARCDQEAARTVLELLETHDDGMTSIASFTNAADLSARLLDLIAQHYNGSTAAAPVLTTEGSWTAMHRTPHPGVVIHGRPQG